MADTATLRTWFHHEIAEDGRASVGAGSLIEPFSEKRFLGEAVAPQQKFTIIPGELANIHNGTADCRLTLLKLSLRSGALRCFYQIAARSAPSSTTDYSLSATLKTLPGFTLSCVDGHSIDDPEILYNPSATVMMADDIEAFIAHADTVTWYLAKVWVYNPGTEDVELDRLFLR